MSRSDVPFPQVGKYMTSVSEFPWAMKGRDVKPGPALSRYVTGIRPYDAVSSLDKIAAKPEQTPFKLDWNESTIPPSPTVIAAINRFLSNSHHLNWYPDLYSRRLLVALGEYVGISPDHLLVTNGSDDALELVCKTYLDPDDQVVVPSPTYTHFLVFAGARGAQILNVYAENPFVHNLDGILRAIHYTTKLVYLVNPNNPTGLMYSEEDVRTLLTAAPNALVIVDEAYYEFAGKSVAHLVQEYTNLVVTRTFSKSFGIAGLRIGYAIGAPELIEDLKRVFNPKSVNVLGQVAAEAALGDKDYLKAYVDEVTDAKVQMVNYFRRRGLQCRTTPANYVLLRIHDPRRFCALLEHEGVYIRDRSSMRQMQHYVRISVGTIAQTEEILNRIGRVLDKMPYAVS